MNNLWIKIQTTFHQYQKLYSTPPWHGAHTCEVSRKDINAFSSYSAKTKRDVRTDGGGGGGRCAVYDIDGIFCEFLKYWNMEGGLPDSR